MPEKPLSLSNVGVIGSWAKSNFGFFVVQLSLTANWSGNDPYTQTVHISGTNENSVVDLQPDATAIAQLKEDGVIGLYIENNNGTLTAVAVGGAPSVAMTLQATVYNATVAPQPTPPTPVVANSGVRFIDYDGTVLYHYTKEQFLALSEMPANPTHAGLTSQGWNWSLSNAKTHVESSGDLIIGQMYITDDGKTRIYIHLEQGRLHPYFGVCMNGTVELDWGDSSSAVTLTGNYIRTVQYADHVYASGGDYVITITATSGVFSFYGGSYQTNILKKDTLSPTSQNDAQSYFVYSNAVKRVELGSNIQMIDESAFNNCNALGSITIPSSVTQIINYAFHNCYSLTSVTIPGGITNVSQFVFQGCLSLKSISLPNSVTTISDYAFGTCNSLDNVTIPFGVTTVAQYSFEGCRSLPEITLPSGLASLGGGAFSSNASIASITIPSGITSIGAYTFSGCFALASVTIPSGVTSIGNNAFSSCCGIAELHFLPTTPPTVANSSAFSRLPTDCVIYVPAGTLSAYTGATNYPDPSVYTYTEVSE